MDDVKQVFFYILKYLTFIAIVVIGVLLAIISLAQLGFLRI